jgi:chemosensory pili system protein ChpC
MSDVPREIRGVLIPVTGGRLLLPNASVAEVITSAIPDAVAGAPPWLSGRVTWRGWHVPLFSFSILSGLTTFDPHENARAVVLKALGGNAQMPFLAVLAQGFPRLTTITPDALVVDETALKDMPGVRASVTVRDESALIPDLGSIEQRVLEALGVTAEATRPA